MADQTQEAPRPAERLAAFDGLIGRLREIVAGLGADGGSAPRELAMPDAGSLAFAHGPHAGRGIVLKSRAAVELGGGSGSSTYVLTSADATLVHDGRVTLVGPDVFEMAPGAEGPVAQILLVAGDAMTGECHQIVEECATVKDYVEGYFLRTGSGDMTSRISNDLYGKGFSFAQLAAALRELVLAEVPSAHAVEAIFVTSSRADVDAVATLRAEAANTAHDLRKEVWAARGVDIDCPSGGHCGNCADKDVCDQVRNIEAMREAVKKELG